MRFGTHLAATALAASSLALVGAGEVRADVLRADAEVVDVGTVASGDDVIATFVLHNQGDEDIRILRAKPS